MNNTKTLVDEEGKYPIIHSGNTTPRATIRGVALTKEIELTEALELEEKEAQSAPDAGDVLAEQQAASAKLKADIRAGKIAAGLGLVALGLSVEHAAVIAQVPLEIFQDAVDGDGGDGGDGGGTDPGGLVVDNFQDGNGNAPFSLILRSEIAEAGTWSASVTGPYQEIPDLRAGDYELVTTGDVGAYTHTFTIKLAGRGQITIQGGTPSPAGDGGKDSVTIKKL